MILFKTACWIGFVIVNLKFKPMVCKNLDPDVVKNKWIPSFSQILSDFTEDVLAYKKIQRDITTHRQNDKINKLSKYIDNEIFLNMMANINDRLIKVKRAAFNIRDAKVKSGAFSGNSNFERCCKQGPTRGLQYEGRLRQEVNTDKACVGSTNRTAIPKLDIHKFYNVFKKNFDEISSVLWQCYATIEGDFVEYPDSHNHVCDEYGNTNSPLTEYLFAVAHSKTEKNVIIVLNTDKDLLREAAKIILKTLTPNDKVNIVVGNSSDNTTPSSCSKRLFVADQRNKDIVEQFLLESRIQCVDMIANCSKYDSDLCTNPLYRLFSEERCRKFCRLCEAASFSVKLETAYKLLLNEKSNNKTPSTTAMDIVVILTDEKEPTTDDAKDLFSMIDKYQKQLGRSISHIVYSLGTPNDRILANVAEQHVPNWPVGLNITPPLSLTPNQNGYIRFFNGTPSFPHEVGESFISSIPETTNRNRDYSIITPVIDEHIGLKMIVAVPVKNKEGAVVATAAVDVSLATLFTEIEDFVFGVHSYAFLLDKSRGHVLLHPKLKNPGNLKLNPAYDPTFPSIEVIEPDLRSIDITSLMSGNDKVGSFSTKIKPGRTTFMTNKIFAPEDVTIIFQHLLRTQFVIVMVMFDSDVSLSKDPFPPGYSIPNAPYHRVDINHRFPVCSVEKHIVTTAAATVKLSPSIFVESERYKFTHESRPTVDVISNFLKGKNNTDRIKEDLKIDIWHSLIETRQLSNYWRVTKDQVIERFYGSSIGVFRIYPGVVLSNSFDHLQYKWYKKTVAGYRDIILSSGKISDITNQDIVIVTRSLTDDKTKQIGSQITNLQGVIGATFTYSHLTALLFNNITDCVSRQLVCHIIDDEGYILTFGNKTPDGKYKFHMTRKFPWLSNKLIRKGVLQPKWCTSMSEGIHKLSYLMASFDIYYELPPDACRQYVFGSVKGTNIFILVLNDRVINGCNESSTVTEECQSCGSMLSRCDYCLSTNSTVCQCPCYCDGDFDQCRNEFDRIDRPDFPHQACFYEPFKQNITEVKQFSPTKPCKKQCQAIEVQHICNVNSHCLWTSNNSFPVCIHKTTTLSSVTTKISIPTKPTKKVAAPTKPSMILKSSLNKVIPTKPALFPTVYETTFESTKSVVTTEQAKQVQNPPSNDEIGLAVGLASVAMVIAVIALFFVWRFFGKTVKESLRKTKAGRYMRRNSVEDQVTFNKTDASINLKLPHSTAIPYGQMTNTE